MSDFLDLAGAAKEYPIGRRTLEGWISAGRLPIYKPFGKRIIRRSDLDRLILQARVGVGPRRVDLDRVIEEIVGPRLRVVK